MNIYTMKLHETVEVDTFTQILRVPGGWIYNTFTENGGSYVVSSTFVRFDNEFQDKEKTPAGWVTGKTYKIRTEPL